MTLDKKLIELRKKAGLSQEELANELGVTRQTISKWECGEATPELEKITKLADFYNVTVDELLGRGEEEVKDEEVTGTILTEEETKEEFNKEKKPEKKVVFAYGSLIFFLALLSFLLLGFIGGFWRWCWLTFLLAIVIDSVIEVILRKRLTLFAYPIFVTFVFLFLGLVTPEIWHPTWLVFISIPVYYLIANYIDAVCFKHKD